MAMWAAWLTAIALLLTAIGTGVQAWTSLAEFKSLRNAWNRVSHAEFSRQMHPRHQPLNQDALKVRLANWLLYSAPAFLSTLMWFYRSIRRFPHALARLRETGGDAEAELFRFNRQLISWTMLMLGSLVALAAACMALVAAGGHIPFHDGGWRNMGGF